MHANKSKPKQTGRVRAVIAVVITAMISGTSGFLLGLRTVHGPCQGNQEISMQPSPIPTKEPLSISFVPKNILYPVLTATPVISAYWKTYTNTRYGYLMQYPADFTAKDIGERGVLFETSQRAIHMYTLLSYNANPDKTLITTGWARHYLMETKAAYYKSVSAKPRHTFEDILIDSKNAVKITEQLYDFKDSYSIIFLIPKDTDILEVQFSALDPPSRTPAIVDTLIDTFVTTLRVF